MKRLEISFVGALIRNRELLCQLTERIVAARYKNSALGLGWSLLQPLVMLGVYTFVFSTIFKSRWGVDSESGSLGYAINLFAGLIVFNLFAECIGGSTGLIIANKNYVTKVIFPLELLSAATLGAAIFQAITSTGILITFELLTLRTVPVTILWLPAVWLQLILLCLALSWALSALCVFVRDLEQLVPVLLSISMFLSAVFYPVSSIPERLQPLMALNPIAVVIEETRKVAVQGVVPDIGSLVTGMVAGAVICECSYRLFQRARRGFADVL